MDNTQHCLLCDHKTQNIKTGIVCGITDKKPDFTKKCGQIKLENRVKERIEEVNINYKMILRKKTDSIFHFCLFMIIGMLVIALSIYLGTYIINNGVISTGPIIIIAIGIGLMGYAIGPLNYYRREIKNAVLLKKRTDILIDLYGLQYEIDIDIIEKRHHEIEVKRNLKISRKNILIS